MTFQAMLGRLLTRTDGSMAVMFLDYEGETVEFAGGGMHQHDLKIVGAYQGIYLTQLRRLSERLGLGEPSRFKIDLAELTVMSRVIDRDYYIVLVADRDANEGVAWRNLDLCRDEILRELA